MFTWQTTHTEKAAWPVTEKVYCSEGVAGASQAAAGAVSEVALLAVLTLQPAVARQTSTLTGALVTFVRIQNPLTTTAAVTKVLWVEEWGVAPNRRDKKWEILCVYMCLHLWLAPLHWYSPACHKRNKCSIKQARSVISGRRKPPHYSLYTYFISTRHWDLFLVRLIWIVWFQNSKHSRLVGQFECPSNDLLRGGSCRRYGDRP